MRGPRGGVAQRLTRFHHPAVSGDISRPSPSPMQSLDYSSVTGATNRRDSDISSLASSRPSVTGRPSSVTGRPSSVTGRPPSVSNTASHFRAVNSYLSSLSPPLHLKPPFPSARDVTEALRRILSRLEFPNAISDVTRDLPPLLAALRCPIKLSKSALKAPSTPHAWPSVLSVLHWLAQLALVADHIAASPASPQPSEANSYITSCYSLFLVGDDGAVADLEAEYLDKVKCHVASRAKDFEALDAEVARYEAMVRDQAVKPSRLESLEAERAVLLEDASKFENVVNKYSGLIEEKKRKLAERERELEKREMEKRRLDEENKELRERTRAQTVSARDVERMMKELQIVERDIAERESRRNEMEEKSLLLDSQLEKKFREIEILAEESNYAIRK